MNYVVGIFLPVGLLIVGLYYSISIHRAKLRTSHVPSIKEILIFLLPAFFKSVIGMSMILLIHNSFHDDHLVELVFFVILLFMFSIFQSSYSLGSFLTRSRSLIRYSTTFFRDSSQRADQFVNRAIDILLGKGQLFIKIIIFLLFIVVFIPNITIFITGNVLYFSIIFLLLALSLLMNNIVYFGIISLLIFQVDPISIHLNNINYLVLILSYLVMLLGFSIEDRLEDKMFYIINVMEVKRFNFKLGYNILYNTKRIIIYQNIINKYYYVYFRDVGIVTVFYTAFDLSLSNQITRQLIREGKAVLIKNSEYL